MPSTCIVLLRLPSIRGTSDCDTDPEPSLLCCHKWMPWTMILCVLQGRPILETSEQNQRHQLLIVKKKKKRHDFTTHSDYCALQKSRCFVPLFLKHFRDKTGHIPTHPKHTHATPRKWLYSSSTPTPPTLLSLSNINTEQFVSWKWFWCSQVYHW